MMVFMSLVLVLIGQFCHDVIGRQKVKVNCIDCMSVVVAIIFQYVYCLLVIRLRSCISCL